MIVIIDKKTERSIIDIETVLNCNKFNFLFMVLLVINIVRDKGMVTTKRKVKVKSSYSIITKPLVYFDIFIYEGDFIAIVFKAALFNKPLYCFEVHKVVLFSKVM